jgi:hypothetical protein
LEPVQALMEEWQEWAELAELVELARHEEELN